jgi:hypothetical protein
MLNWRAAAQFSFRPQSAKRYVYVRADGNYLQARLEREKQCILVLATPEGSGAVKARKVGSVWARLNVRPELADCRRRAEGCRRNPPASSWVHRSANVLARLPKT